MSGCDRYRDGPELRFDESANQGAAGRGRAGIADGQAGGDRRSGRMAALRRGIVRDGMRDAGRWRYDGAVEGAVEAAAVPASELRRAVAGPHRGRATALPIKHGLGAARIACGTQPMQLSSARRMNAAPNLPLQLRRRLDEIARYLLEPRDHLALGLGRVEHNELDLLRPGVAISLEVVRLDWCHVWRDREFDVRALSPVCLEQLLEATDFSGRIGRIEVETDPSVAILGDAPQRRAALTTKPYGKPPALDGFGIAANVFEIYEFTTEGTAVVAPQLAHRLDIFSRTLCAPFERDAQCHELLRKPSDADAEYKTPSAQPVHGRDRLGQIERIMLGNEANTGREPDPVGAGGSVGKRRERITNRRLGRHWKFAIRVWVARGVVVEQDDMLGRPQTRKSQPLDVGRDESYPLRFRQPSHADSEESDLHFLILLCPRRDRGGSLRR